MSGVARSPNDLAQLAKVATDQDLDQTISYLELGLFPRPLDFFSLLIIFIFKEEQKREKESLRRRRKEGDSVSKLGINK